MEDQIINRVANSKLITIDLEDWYPEGVRTVFDIKDWLDEGLSLKEKELPQAVKEAIKAQYKDVKIVEIERTDHHKKGIFYDVEFKENGQKFDIEFNAEGEIIGREG